MRTIIVNGDHAIHDVPEDRIRELVGMLTRELPSVTVWVSARLRKAERTVDRNGGINISGWYGSIEVDSSDFVPETSSEE